MAELSEPNFVHRLEDAIRQRLGHNGNGHVEVSHQRLPGTDRFRFAVVSPVFSPMSHSERQDVVWRIVTQTLGADEHIDGVSMILTLSPSEVQSQN